MGAWEQPLDMQRENRANMTTKCLYLSLYLRTKYKLATKIEVAANVRQSVKIQTKEEHC